MRTRRATAGGLAAALIAATMVAGANVALAQSPEARDIDSACEDAPDDSFQDTGGEVKEAAGCIVWYDVTSGFTATEYRPQLNTTRGQMARFVAQVMRPSNEPFDEAGSNEDFFDDDNGGIFEPDINFVAKHGVVDGTGPREYSPTQPVTRGQMAKFIVGMLEAIGAEIPEPSQHYFDDVPENGIFTEFINQVAEMGIAAGFTATEYRPGQTVTRGQMARFMARSLAELTDQELMLNPDEREVVVDLDSGEVQRGSDVSGSITSGSEPESAVLNGCGLTGVTLEDDDTSEAGIQFSETIPESQDVGECVLTFDVSLANGQDVTVEETITVVDHRDSTLTLFQRTVAQGSQLSGEVIPNEDADNIDEVSVDGCGVSNQTLSDQDSSKDGVQFSFTIPTNAPVGECDLTFTVDYVMSPIPLPSGSDEFVETIQVVAGSGASATTAAPRLTGVSSPQFFDAPGCSGAGTSQPVSGETTHVRFGMTFNEPITGRSVPANASGFSLVSFDGQSTNAQSAILSPNDNRIAEACWVHTAHINATTVAVAGNTVGNVANIGNIEGDLALKSVSLTGTNKPEITALGTVAHGDGSSTYPVTFDQVITSVTTDGQTGFRLVTSTGASLSSTAAAPILVDGAPTNKVSVTFPSTQGLTPARIAAVAGAVQSSSGQNAHTVRRLTATTAGPDLASTVYDPDATRNNGTTQVDEIRFVFTESVLLATPAEKFRAIRADGTEIIGTEATRSTADARVVIVRFPDRALTRVTSAVVLGGAVRAAAGAQQLENRIDALPRSPGLSYAGGQTLGPVPVEVSIASSSGVATTSFTLTMRFDRAVDSSIEDGRITVYDEDGRRYTFESSTVSTGSPSRSNSDHRVITVTASEPTGGTDASIINGTVFVGIAEGLVTDSAGNPSHDRSIVK